MIEIDIRTEVVPRSRSVWRLFPGQAYRFLDDFKENSALFLDLPGLNVSSVNYLDADISWKVLAALELGQLIRAGRVSEAQELQWEQFVGQSVKGHPKEIINSIGNLYREAKRDDLVVVPTNIKTRMVHVGQFIDDPANALPYKQRRYAPYAIPARAVRWLAQIDETKLSGDLISSLRNQHAFSLLPRSIFPEIFSFAYKNFTTDFLSGSVVFNSTSTYTQDDAGLINYITQVAAKSLYSHWSGSSFSLDEDAIDFISNEIPFEFKCDQSVDIHSEGFNRFVSKRLTPIVVSAIVSGLELLSASPTAEEVNSHLAKIAVINSSSPDADDCNLPVEAAVKLTFDVTHLAKLQKLCDAWRKAHARSGLNVHSRGRHN